MRGKRNAEEKEQKKRKNMCRSHRICDISDLFHVAGLPAPGWVSFFLWCFSIIVAERSCRTDRQLPGCVGRQYGRHKDSGWPVCNYADCGSIVSDTADFKQIPVYPAGCERYCDYRDVSE